MSNASKYLIREAIADDLQQITSLLRAELNKGDDPRYGEYLRWKHLQNPFGRSKCWVALDEGNIIGVRPFMQWRYLTSGSGRINTVRAVDAATATTHQRRGIFRELTITAIASLTHERFSSSLNTPNDKSGPGNLSMGWSDEGRIPVGVVPSGARGIAKMGRSRTAASLWSCKTDVGIPAHSAVQDRNFIERLLLFAPNEGVRTDRSFEYLRWRIGFRDLEYRLLMADNEDPDAGGLIFRLRRRGVALEAVLVEQLVPNRRTASRLMRSLLERTQADYIIGIRTGATVGLLPAPRVGPRLVSRPLAATPPDLKSLCLSMGDVELF